LDAFAADEVAAFMPEPGGLTVSEVETMVREAREEKPLLGAGITALLPREENLAPISRLTAALGL
jgi:arginase family enzyme